LFKVANFGCGPLGALGIISSLLFIKCETRTNYIHKRYVNTFLDEYFIFFKTIFCIKNCFSFFFRKIL